MAARCGVLLRQSRTPLDVGYKRRAELGIGGQTSFVSHLADQASPPCPLGLSQRFPDVLGDHAGIAAVVLGVALRPPKDLTEPGSYALGMVWGHVGEQGPNQRILRDVLLIEQAREPHPRTEDTSPSITRCVLIPVRHPVHRIYMTL